MNSIRTITFFFLFLFLYLSCAKQSNPTGGPKDTIPPRLISSTPAHHQINFNSKKIDLTFSETIILNNPKEQILITPTIAGTFKAVTKNKDVILEFENNFKDTTTYTITFRDAIQDITEKNPAKNLHLAFATGPYLDSLIISGKIIDAITRKELKDITVALYQSDTFNIFKHKPLYATRSDEKGLFKIENIKKGNYQIYAIEDKSKNLIVDSKNEAYGFISDTLELAKNITNVTIPILHLDARPLKITSSRPSNNYFNIRASKPLVTYSLSSDTTKLISAYGEDRSNVRIYNFIKSDSLPVKFNAVDSIGNSIDTLLYVKFSKKKTDPEKMSMSVDNSSLIENTRTLQTKISFNKPIALINFDSIFFQPDSLTTLKFTEAETQWDYPTNTLTLKKLLDKKYLEKEKVQTQTQPKRSNHQQTTVKNLLTLGNSAFISVDQDSSKKKTEQLKVLRNEDTGLIIVNINTDEKNFITQLVTANCKVIETIKNAKSLRFENLEPATYMIRLIIDKNGNGIWDPGNYFKQEEPEQIIYYKNEKKNTSINLKANWELGPLLITY